MSKVHASGLLVYRVRATIEYLLLQTSYGEHHWTPPKGHLDPGEDEMTAAVRETVEESGLTQEHYLVDECYKKILQYKVKGKDKVVSYWLAKLTEKDAVVKLSDEHQAYGWFCLKDAIAHAKYPEMICLLKDADSYILNKLNQKLDET